MKSIVKKAIVILLVMTLTIGALSTLSGCKKEKEKKAMILIHGICGGAFYDAKTNEPIYAIDTISTDLLGEINTLVAGIDKMELDENGEPIYDLRIANMNDTRGKYTMLAMFEPLYNALKAKYGEEYEITVWQYDWRKQTALAAAELEKFINDNDYDKVQFFAHSMGGNIVSEYMVKNQANRDKVELFVPFSTPFYGSADAYFQIIDGLFFNLGGVCNSIPVGDTRKDLSSAMSLGLVKQAIDGVVKPNLKELTLNMPSVIMLSPFNEYYGDPVYANGETPIKIDGVYKNHSEVWDFYKAQGFAKKSDNTLKFGYEKCLSYQQGHFVDYNGKRVHISNTVNTHYIVGKGIDTLKSFNINTADMTCTSAESTAFGDGVVSMYSGTAGNPYDAYNVSVIEGSSHISVITDEAAINACLAAVKNLLGY